MFMKVWNFGQYSNRVLTKIGQIFQEFGMRKLDILLFFFGWDWVQTSVPGHGLLWRRKGAAEIERPFGRRYFTLTVPSPVRSEGSRNKSSGRAGIKFGAKNGMKNEKTSTVCIYIYYIFTHTYNIR